MENIYSLGTPVFEYAKVNVRASKETLDSITFVKALIDVTNVTGEFTQKAKIVAYDKNGQPVNADIVPDEISVTVPVSSPNKVVPIEVEINGTLPDNLAIDSISMDQKSVTIYASESVLSKIDKDRFSSLIYALWWAMAYDNALITDNRDLVMTIARMNSIGAHRSSSLNKLFQ